MSWSGTKSRALRVRKQTYDSAETRAWLLNQRLHGLHGTVRLRLYDYGEPPIRCSVSNLSRLAYTPPNIRDIAPNRNGGGAVSTFVCS